MGKIISMEAASLLSDIANAITYLRPRKSKARDELKRLGLIESFRPVYRFSAGHGSCWRLTSAGHALLTPEPNHDQ